MIKLYNTLTHKKEEFVPIKSGHVGIYACGPTVYWYAHIGNLRTYIFEDLLKRVFFYNDYKVKHVMNITDVGHLVSDADHGEDKMLVGARREGKTIWEIAKFYEEAFFKDTHRLNILPPDTVCRATAHVKDMIKLIEKLEHSNMTYIANGNVYYDISKFKPYGQLARLNLEELKSGVKVEVDTHKRNPHDFVLWFTRSKFHDQEMKWQSPWGNGYPGWHIECSAMSMKYLGDHFDIHCGGIDHISVHHTNEIAQSEGVTGKRWVNYWVHGEFLIEKEGKMSKSSGETLTLDALERHGYTPMDYRYLCLNTHYRIPLSFTFDALTAAKNAFSGLRDKILEFRRSDKEIVSTGIIDKYRAEFLEAIGNDLNMPEALAIMWSVVKDKELNDREKYLLLLDFDRVFGLGLDKIEHEDVIVPEEVMSVVRERERARRHKDFKKSDQLRDVIKMMGFHVDDTDTGPKLKRV
ncbi:MAG: cysteine--tRNA ligase [Candidatus Woesearchaeota archaeon]